jgi:hypothetical protein
VVIHGSSGCNKKIIKNKLVATRSGEFTISGKVVISGQVVRNPLALKEGSWVKLVRRQPLEETT